MIFEQWLVNQDMVHPIPDKYLNAKFWYSKINLQPQQTIDMDQAKADLLNQDAFHTHYYYLLPGEFPDGNIFV